ncbi:MULTISPECIES: hypothetical protein [Exiguobacterium]|uniref:hypothetical protein n=1 Tax=Exiguobacterium TaxID=33986 RepID=UPI001BED1110|nr:MULTISPECIES: hypothetical protein [Exiguobacterium]MCT4776374.1 hypothetical protein [Exiguobacterium aquaticum]MCT4789254.1 hypothetical protein [Exiguobacterium mexicanum]
MTIEEIQRIAKALKTKFKEMQPYIEPGKKITKQINMSIVKGTSDIDFSRLDEVINEAHEKVKDRTEQMIENNIFPNIDILDSISFAEMDENFSSSWVLKWMEEHLESKIDILVKDKSCFGSTTILLHQSFNAYKRGDFILGFMALYPVIDTFVSHWHESKDGRVQIQGDKIKSLQYVDKKKMIERQKTFRDSLDPLEGFAFHLLFVSHALSAFPDMYSERGHRGFKRHHTMHGSLNYSLVKKEDYVKLFFYLYSLYQVTIFSLDDNSLIRAIEHK